MKKYLLTFFILLTIFSMYSCSNDIQISEDKIISQKENEDYSDINELGDIIECPLHTISFHSINSRFIEYVGENEFYKWVNEMEEINDIRTSNSCIYNISILSFIEHFKIEKDTFYDLYYNVLEYYNSDHSIDCLYSGDINKIDEYYSDKEISNLRLQTRELVYDLKSRLYNLIDEVYKNENYKDINRRLISIPELVAVSQITVEEFENILSNVNNNDENTIDLKINIESLNTSKYNDADAIYIDDELLKENTYYK